MTWWKLLFLENGKRGGSRSVDETDIVKVMESRVKFFLDVGRLNGKEGGMFKRTERV